MIYGTGYFILSVAALAMLAAAFYLFFYYLRFTCALVSAVVFLHLINADIGVSFLKGPDTILAAEKFVVILTALATMVAFLLDYTRAKGRWKQLWNHP